MEIRDPKFQLDQLVVPINKMFFCKIRRRRWNEHVDVGGDWQYKIRQVKLENFSDISTGVFITSLDDSEWHKEKDLRDGHPFLEQLFTNEIEKEGYLRESEEPSSKENHLRGGLIFPP